MESFKSRRRQQRRLHRQLWRCISRCWVLWQTVKRTLILDGKVLLLGVILNLLLGGRLALGLGRGGLGGALLLGAVRKRGTAVLGGRRALGARSSVERTGALTVAGGLGIGEMLGRVGDLHVVRLKKALKALGTGERMSVVSIRRGRERDLRGALSGDAEFLHDGLPRDLQQ